MCYNSPMPIIECVPNVSEGRRADVLETFAQAIRGERPRIGAVDVVPFVPIDGVTMAECVALARDVGQAIAERHHLPVFLYEEAASAPSRRNLEDIRRGE